MTAAAAVTQLWRKAKAGFIVEGAVVLLICALILFPTVTVHA